MDGVVEPQARHRDGTARRPRGPQSRGHLLPLRESRTTFLDRITSASHEEATKIIQAIYGEPIKEELIHKRISEIKKGGGPGRRLVDPAARRALRQDRRGGRRRLLRRAVHGDHGASRRHRVHAGRPPQAEEASVHPAHRRQLRHLRGVPRADGDGRGRAADRRRPGRGLHEPRGARPRRAPGDRHRRLRGRARLLLQADRALRADHHRRRHDHRRRYLQGASPPAPTR